MKAFKLALAALGALALQGCVSMMTSGSYYNYFNTVHDTIKQANQVYTDAQHTFTEVTKRSSSPQAAPYPSLASHLRGMKAQVDIMNAQDGEFLKLRHAYEHIANNRSEMRSDMPEWPAVLKNREEVNALTEKLKAEGAAFNNEANAYAREADAGGVGHIKSSEYKKKLKNQLGSLGHAAKEVRSKIVEAKAKLNGSIVLGDKKKALATLDRMSALADKIEARSKPLEAKAQAFIDANTDENIWRGPGIPKQAVVEELNHAISDIQPLIEQFNAEVDKLNK